MLLCPQVPDNENHLRLFQTNDNAHTHLLVVLANAVQLIAYLCSPHPSFGEERGMLDNGIQPHPCGFDGVSSSNTRR